MERLTQLVNGIPAYVGTGCEAVDGSLPAEMSIQQVGEVLARLEAYEETGLIPKEVDELKRDSAALQELMQEISPLRLKELAEADKDGRVVVLPCKVGDKAWCVFDDAEKKGIYETRVYGISVSATGNDVILHFGGYPAVNAWGSSFGKTVFLTHEEAEAALKEAADG